MTRPSSLPRASRAPARQLLDAAGKPVAVGREIARGGEGVIVEIEGAPGLVAKLYTRGVNPAREAKLHHMSASGSARLSTVAAWPISTLHEGRNGPLRGFLMPRITGRHEVHEFFSPAQRKNLFPGLGWKFLVRIARNIAAAMEEIHASGFVIGDVNQKGFLVCPLTAQATAIDCDSFQVKTGHRTYRCEVGVPEFTPPELLGRSFSEIDRTPDHDAFGLAVLVFQLLFMGRHPFAGKTRRPDGSLEAAIREFQFVHAPEAGKAGIEAPVHGLPFKIASARVRALFQVAFSREAASGHRPSPGDWVGALEALEAQITACPKSEGHEYWHDLQDCPWCEHEVTNGVFHFLPGWVQRAVPQTGEIDLHLVRRRLDELNLQERVESLVRARPCPVRHLSPVPAVIRRRSRFFFLWREVLTALGTFCVAMALFHGWRSAAAGLLLHAVARVRYIGGSEEEERRTNAVSRAERKLAEATVRLRHAPAVDRLQTLRATLDRELLRHAGAGNRRRSVGALRSGLAQLEVLHRAARRDLELSAEQVRLAKADLEKAEAELMEIQEVLRR